MVQVRKLKQYLKEPKPRQEEHSPSDIIIVIPETRLLISVIHSDLIDSAWDLSLISNGIFRK